MMTFHDKSAIQVTNVTLNVKNLTDMVDFYTHILGLTVMSKNENTATLQVGLNGHTMTLFKTDVSLLSEKQDCFILHYYYLKEKI